MVIEIRLIYFKKALLSFLIMRIMSNYIHFPRNAVFSFKVFKSTVDFKYTYIKIKVFTKKFFVKS